MQNNIKQSEQIPQPQHYDEEILVIKRSLLFQNIQPWQGIIQDGQDCLNAITEHTSFMPRSHAETNKNYKQIIPYMLFLHEQKLFVMQRKSTASEQRLASKFSLGIGGHVRQEDMTNNEIITWANREFEEEVTYQGSKTMTTLGILNDDSSDVGIVHLGIILLIQADSDKISINDEHKSGVLLTAAECKALRPQMENWSQICLDFLFQQKILQ